MGEIFVIWSNFLVENIQNQFDSFVLITYPIYTLVHHFIIATFIIRRRNSFNRSLQT